MDQKPKRALACYCNGVSRAEVEDAIRGGCHSLGRIFDETTAGVGACGGTCQPTLKTMLDAYLNTGQFPEPPPSRRPKRR